MGLEATTTIAGLVQTNPVAGDELGKSDDHLRLIKTVLKTIFPGSGGSGFSIPITASEAELNFVDGVTSPIQTQLNTISGNATTALANSTTADGKAVAAQSTANTALANAATADAKAVTAQAMGADAWACLDGTSGAVLKGLNVASVSKSGGTNIFDITFTNAMPNTSYAIIASTTDSYTMSSVSAFTTVNGFRLICSSSNPARVSFAVFAVA